jgi:signal transduction histidine kinase
MLGRTRWELPGSIPTTKDRSLIDAAVEARLPYRNLGYDVVSPDGSRHYVQSSAEPIFNEAGQFSGYRGVGRDITELKRSERLKDEFVATVSHELRTPLTSIAGSLSLLMGGKAGELPESASRLLAIAHANSQRLVRLVNDILDIEKLESGQVVFKLIWLDVVPIVEQAIEEIRGFADVYGAHITLIATPTTRKVHVDPDRLAQVLTNLFSNAIKFSAKGEEVTVTVELRGEAVRISVRDRGPGIPIDFRPNIFRKFAQANATNTRERGGTGLGLTIVQQIVNRLDGEVGFEDAPGGGSIFHVEFPSWDVIPTGAPDANGISESGRLTERQDRSLQ